MKNPQSILVTGGSSGLGEGLCKYFAKPGVHIAFCGLNEKRVDEVAEFLRSKGATVDARVLDVTDKNEMEKWILVVDEHHPLELVIANAGIATPEDESMSLDEKVKRIFSVNVDGVFNTIHPILGPMIQRKRGQIVLMSSLAGFMGLGHSPAYSAGKATIKAYGRALRTRHANDGIQVTTVCPAVIPTRMTEKFYNRFPGWIPYDRAIMKIGRGIEAGKGLIVIPRRWHLVMWWLSTLPHSWQDLLFRLYYRSR